MNLIPISLITRSTAVATTSLLVLLAFSTVAAPQTPSPLLLDDYSDSKTNRNGVGRLLIDDKAVIRAFPDPKEPGQVEAYLDLLLAELDAR